MDANKLIELLVDDPRATVTDLADILNDTEENVDQEIKRLENEKVICGYHTVINWDKANKDHVGFFKKINS